MTEFDAWADYYDIIHTGLEGETEFYAGQAIRCESEVLEVGCGTGRVCIPMAMCGVDVTGIDISGEMLAICREKLDAVSPTPGRLRLIQADMRDFAVDKRFALAVLPYRTFMHLLTPEEQVRGLLNIARHVEPGGRIILNVWAATPSAIVHAQNNAPENMCLIGAYDTGCEGITLMHYHSARYDEYRQLLVEQHHVEERDVNKRLLGRRELRLTRAWLTRREMEHLVYRCGLMIEDLLGNFEGESFSEESTEMIWVLKKP